LKTAQALLKIFDSLLDHYGARRWWPAKTRFEVIVGAILVQNVSWKNAKIAVNGLKKAGLLTVDAIVFAKHEVIANTIRSARFYNQKTIKLKSFCKYLTDKYDGSLNKMFSRDADELRNELLNVSGIGRETADSILLYAGRKLSFVSDSYTKRFLTRYGLLGNMKTYEEIRDFFMSNLPKDVILYNEYHALIVHHCYATCKSDPSCHQCAVRSLGTRFFCQYGKVATK
jgi:endonuclease-3 related protein